MKLSPALASGLSLLSLGLVKADSQTSDGSSSKIAQPATFKPPQVFKNANLVHIISLERNYVKETVNVVIENIDKAAQDEYYLPFSADQMARVGGMEVKDKKDTNAGSFDVQAVEFDQARCEAISWHDYKDLERS
jgi:oligosaccharyltransferase complex subunit alpha (ribophorin I)